MVSFKIISDKSIIVTIINDFKNKDLKGISILVDALFENNFNKNLHFLIDNKIENQCKHALENYCEQTPYNYQINRLG